MTASAPLHVYWTCTEVLEDAGSFFHFKGRVGLKPWLFFSLSDKDQKLMKKINAIKSMNLTPESRDQFDAFVKDMLETMIFLKEQKAFVESHLGKKLLDNLKKEDQVNNYKENINMKSDVYVTKPILTETEKPKYGLQPRKPSPSPKKKRLPLFYHDAPHHIDIPGVEF